MNSLRRAFLGKVVISASSASQKGAVAEETKALGSASVGFDAARGSDTEGKE